MTILSNVLLLEAILQGVGVILGCLRAVLGSLGATFENLWSGIVNKNSVWEGGVIWIMRFIHITPHFPSSDQAF